MNHIRNFTGWIAAIVYAAFALTIVAAGIRYHNQDRAETEDRAEDQLHAIAEARVLQLVSWRRERLHDLLQARNSAAIMPAVRAVLRGTASGSEQRSVHAWLESLLADTGCRGLSLVTQDGHVRMSLGVMVRPDDLATPFSEIVSGSRPAFLGQVSRREGAADSGIPMAAVLHEESGEAAAGALLCYVDAAEQLFTIVAGWPGAARTGEMMLLRRDGDEVTVLNELRLSRGSALRMKIPMSRLDRAAVRALKGGSSLIKALDYREKRVVAHVRPVPDSPWVLLVKVDEDEIMAGLRERRLLAAASGLFLLISSGLALYVLWRRGEAAAMRKEIEAKRVQEALHDRYHSLARHANDIILYFDENWRILDANEKALAAYQYDQAEMLELTVHSLRAPEHQADLEARLASADMGRGIVYETVHVRKDGTPFPVEISLRAVGSSGRMYRLGILRDITERKRAEEEKNRLQVQLAQAQKMESIGQLAGGIAHDFNNQLAVINGYSALVLTRLPAGDESRGPIEAVRRAGERAADLTRQLLTFSRKQDIQPRPVNLNHTVAEFEKMASRLIGEDIVLTMDLAPSLRLVLADRGQMHQLLLNLAVNARDAMPRGGHLQIATANVDVACVPAVEFPEAAPGPHVLLSVSDGGVGMDKATLDRIFEPFFTTKPPGQGTGLGLPTVYGIVKQARGFLTVDSVPGKGTTFKIYLPRCEGEAPEGTGISFLATMPGGTETILLVEDEEGLRQFTVEILSGLGYRVIEAAEGVQALALYQASPDPILLLITDVILPGMSGPDLAGQLTKSQPDLKVLFVSGYAGESLDRGGMMKPDTEYLAKPFTPSQLAMRVRGILDSPTSPT